MVPPMINRKRGKTLEARRNDNRRMKQASLRAEGKETAAEKAKKESRRMGNIKRPAPTKKKQKLLAKRARIVAEGKNAGKDADGDSMMS